MEKKIAIIGSGLFEADLAYHRAYEELKENGIIIISDHNSPPPRRPNNPYIKLSNGEERWLKQKGIDIYEEFDLIGQKKSNLPAKVRAEVIRLYNKLVTN